MVTVLEVGTLVAFVPTTAGMTAEPEAPKPVFVLLLVQEYTAPLTGPAMLIALLVVPAQITCAAMGVTLGIGLTVTV
jgi:hypothetical protein